MDYYLTEEQKEVEPRNGDSHLTFIGSGMRNCVTYRNQPPAPVFFIDLDGTHESRELIDLYANARTFEVVRRLSSMSELQEDLYKALLESQTVNKLLATGNSADALSAIMTLRKLVNDP